MTQKTKTIPTNKPVVAVFGATGHTGRFVIAELLRREMTPIAIARKALSEAEFPEKVVRRQATVDDAALLNQALHGAQAVINCAGPFIDTADAIASAALRAEVHYVDVCAEQISASKTLEKYAWPNPDKLYCRSYCPRHPKVHEVVFALVDEVCDAFEADAFHAGMDEVFYIGEDQCPRCKGRNKAELFAEEVLAIHDHLQAAKRQLWLWGDRLLDGKLTGLGEWEASRNDTYPAVDLIPKDVVICDWHYARADQTAVYFAMKGLDVVSCAWKNPDAAIAQVKDMVRFRESSTPQMKQHFQGVVETIWSGSGDFLDQYYGRKPANEPKNAGYTESKCFVRMFEEIANLK